MRALNRNKQKMLYSLQTGRSTPIYEKDEQGNTKYITVDGREVPVESGEYEPEYTEPTEFMANINSTLTEAFIRVFGVEDSVDKATIVCSKGALPFAVGTRIWRKSSVKYKDPANGLGVDANTADYEVMATNDEALNEDAFLLKKISKEG